MLVKCAVCLHLVNDKHIAIRRIIRQVDVDMVTVNAFGTTNVTVGVVHRNAPLLAVCVLAAASATLGVLNGNVKAVNLHMSLLVVACLLLCIRRVGFRSCLCCRNSGCKVIFARRFVCSVSCWFLLVSNAVLITQLIVVVLHRYERI